MQKILKGLFFGLLLLLVLPIVSFQAGAITTSTNSLQKQTLIDSKKLASNAALTNKATRASEFAPTACETHVRVINLRQKNIIAHAERVQNRLSKLTTAVGKYYTEKLLPQGKTVANYSTLVADVNSKQVALATALDKIKADTEGLTCEKNQAKTQFTTFRTDMQSLLKAFKDYRLSVLQLMQAVKRAGGNTDGAEASSSAQKGE